MQDVGAPGCVGVGEDAREVQAVSDVGVAPSLRQAEEPVAIVSSSGATSTLELSWVRGWLGALVRIPRGSLTINGTRIASS